MRDEMTTIGSRSDAIDVFNCLLTSTTLTKRSSRNQTALPTKEVADGR